MFLHNLFEDEAKRVIVTYPGRFQPFHKGHLAVFSNLQAKYGSDNVFIVTSNKTDAVKSPFNFSDKVQFMHAMGIPDQAIIESDKVYDLPTQFDSIRNQVVFITVVGAPDEKRLQPGRLKKDGTEGYFLHMPRDKNELVTADQHGYVIVEPEHPEVITVGGKQVDVSHGTPCRELWNAIRNNPQQRAEFIKQLYGRNDAELGHLLDKIPTGAAEPAPAASPKLRKPGTGTSPALKPIKVPKVTAEGVILHKDDLVDIYIKGYVKGQRDPITKKVGAKIPNSMVERYIDQVAEKFRINHKAFFYTPAKLDEDAAGVGVIASKKQKKDPRYSMSMSVDVGPGADKKAQRQLSLGEGLADDILKIAKQRNPNARIAGTPEQERQRTADMMAQRKIEQDRATAAATEADRAQLTELKAQYEQMKAEFESLGGNSYQYADREQNLSANERKARDMVPGLQRLGSRIARAEKGLTEGFDKEAFRQQMRDLEAREELRKTDPVSAKALDLRGQLPQKSKKKPEDDAMSINDPRHPQYAYTQAGHQGVAEGEVVAFPKKHKGDLEDTHSCVKCGGDLQGGTYMGHKVKVCMPCKQVYLPPNSNIDQQGNPIKEGTIDRRIARTQALIQDYYDRSRNTRNDIKRDHYIDMARQLEYELEGMINDARQAEQDSYDVAQHDAEPSATWNRGGLAEGAKVDRMVKHIKASEKKAGHSDKEAESIAWATANKRGMLDNKNKKVNEAFNSKQEVIDHFVKQGKSAAAGASAWERGWRGPKQKPKTTKAPQAPQQKYWWQDKDLDESIDDDDMFGNRDPNAWRVDGRAVDSSSIYIGGIDRRDYPDYCDAHVEDATFMDGTPLNDEELNDLTEQMAEDGALHERIYDQLHEDKLGLKNRRNRFKSIKRLDEEELQIGDPVIITGEVQFKGSTGDVDSFGTGKRFVVVNLYNYGKHSFHTSDVSYNDYNHPDEESTHDFDMDESMYSYDKEDPMNSEFAPDVGMGRMTLRGWKQSLIRRASQYAKELQDAGQHIDSAAVWEKVHKDLQALNMDPVAKEIELAHQELERIRRQGGLRSKAFSKYGK